MAPQPTLMLVPFGLSARATTSAPSRSNADGAIPEYAPFAQSTAILRPSSGEPNRSRTCSV